MGTRLTYTDLIEIVASTSLVLAGFTAVVGVFRRGSDSSWTPQEIEGAKMMISNSFAALSISLLALTLEAAGSQLVFRVSSAALAVFMLFSVLLLWNALVWELALVFLLGLFWVLFTVARQFFHFVFPKQE